MSVKCFEKSVLLAGHVILLPKSNSCKMLCTQSHNINIFVGGGHFIFQGLMKRIIFFDVYNLKFAAPLGEK